MSSISEEDSVLFLRNLYNEGGIELMLEYLLESIPHSSEIYSDNDDFIAEVQILHLHINIQYIAAKEKIKYLNGDIRILTYDLNNLEPVPDDDLELESERIHIRNDDIDTTLTFHYNGTLYISSNNDTMNTFLYEIVDDEYYIPPETIKKKIAFKNMELYLNTYDRSIDFKVVAPILEYIKDYNVLISKHFIIKYERLGG